MLGGVLAEFYKTRSTKRPELGKTIGCDLAGAGDWEK